MERVIGRLLRGARGRDRHLAWNAPALLNAPETIVLASPAFGDGQPMPTRHAGPGVGDNLSPPLSWSGVPAAAAELVLIVEDPDAPLPRPAVHLIATGIAPARTAFAEGALGTGATDVRLGRGLFGRRGYAGPRPVLGHGPHRYFFQIMALDQPLALGGAGDRAALLAAAAGHVLARGQLIGTYERR